MIPRLLQSLPCALALAPIQYVSAAANWEVGVVYDGAAVVQTMPGVTATANFTRNKPTVDDNGVGVPSNERRFSAQPVGIAGSMDWQATSFHLGPQGRLLGSGPDLNANRALLVGDNQNAVTLYVFELDRVTGQFTKRSETPWTQLPGAGVGGKSYRPEGACVWYGLIVLYAGRYENGQCVGITLFYSQDGGVSWAKVPNVPADEQDMEVGDVPPNSLAPAGELVCPRGREWAAPKPFPTGGLVGVRNFSQVDVNFAWTDYMAPPGQPRGY